MSYLFEIYPKYPLYNFFENKGGSPRSEQLWDINEKMQSWMNENISGEWYIFFNITFNQHRPQSHCITLTFIEDSDAILFKLTWL